MLSRFRASTGAARVRIGAVGVAALAQYGNDKTDYAPSAGQPVLTHNLNNSVAGCGTGNASPCTRSASLGAFTSGVATATFTPYKAESGRTLTVTDGPPSGPTGTSAAF